MEYVAPGLLKMEEGLTFYRGRLFGVSNASEFEDTIHMFDAVTDSTNGRYFQVKTMLPRGFVDDLFTLLYQEGNNAEIAMNPSMGRVFIRHGIEPGIEPDSLNFKLVNSYGEELDQGWFFGTAEDGFVK